VPMFEAFDYSNTTSPLPERPITTVAPQALMLLNDAFMQQQAAAVASRISREAGSDREAEVRRAYALAFNRAPSRSEMQSARGFLERSEGKFSAISRRNTFHLDVPTAISAEYFQKLEAAQFLKGPTEDWSYYRGAWAPPYEGIRVADREKGPFALWNGVTFQDGVIEADVLLSESAEFASLLWRAKPEAEKAHGYELVLAPRSKEIVLRKQTEKMQVLGRAEAGLPMGRSFHVKVQAKGGRFSVWIGEDSRPVLEVPDEDGLTEPGKIGVRSWGGAVSVDDLRVMPFPEMEWKYARGQNPDPARRALESFCLLVLNLNELIYID
jgi:hypothetical protein